MLYVKVVPRNFTKFTGKHLCQSLFLIKLHLLGLLIVLFSSIAHAVLYWKKLIPFYQRISRIFLKICFSRSCLPSRATKHILEILLAYRHILFSPNYRVSARLHHCQSYQWKPPKSNDVWCYWTPGPLVLLPHCTPKTPSSKGEKKIWVATI